MPTASRKRALGTLLLLLAFFALPARRADAARQATSTTPQHKTYLGFDTNLYPGDALLPALHRQFAYLGYWLNKPPGTDANQWAGRRAALRRAGFGFLILFNGRLDKQLRHADAAGTTPAKLGSADGAKAARAAKTQGFPRHAIIFLDLEEGGRMLPEQLAYIGAWMHAVRASGYRPGVYCSGIQVHDSGQMISSAEDIAAHFPGIAIWTANDRCPPAPGCVARPLPPAQSGFPHALVWQFSQSPRRRALTRACAETYAADGNCYAPGLPHNQNTALDLDTSTTPDPSHGR